MAGNFGRVYFVAKQFNTRVPARWQARHPGDCQAVRRVSNDGPERGQLGEADRRRAAVKNGPPRALVISRSCCRPEPSDRADYTVFCGEWNIGRIYEVRGGPEHLRWFWALHFPSKPEGLRHIQAKNRELVPSTPTASDNTDQSVR